MDKIVAEIDKERDDLLEYREKVKRWKSFNKKLDIDNLEYITADLLEFYDPVTPHAFDFFIKAHSAEHPVKQAGSWILRPSARRSLSAAHLNCLGEASGKLS